MTRADLEWPRSTCLLSLRHIHGWPNLCSTAIYSCTDSHKIFHDFYRHTYSTIRSDSLYIYCPWTYEGSLLWESTQLSNHWNTTGPLVIYTEEVCFILLVGGINTSWLGAFGNHEGMERDVGITYIVCQESKEQIEFIIDLTRLALPWLLTTYLAAWRGLPPPPPAGPRRSPCFVRTRVTWPHLIWRAGLRDLTLCRPVRKRRKMIE